jgi:hypothetical protein
MLLHIYVCSMKAWEFVNLEDNVLVQKRTRLSFTISLFVHLASTLKKSKLLPKFQFELSLIRGAFSWTVKRLSAAIN